MLSSYVAICVNDTTLIDCSLEFDVESCSSLLNYSISNDLSE